MQRGKTLHLYVCRPGGHHWAYSILLHSETADSLRLTVDTPTKTVRCAVKLSGNTNDRTETLETPHRGMVMSCLEPLTRMVD